MKRGLVFVITLLIFCIFANSANAITNNKTKAKKSVKNLSEVDLVNEKTQVIKIKDGDVLSIVDCIHIGLANSPKIKQYAYKLAKLRHNEISAKVNWFAFSGGATYSTTLNSAGIDSQNQTYGQTSNYAHRMRVLPAIYLKLESEIFDLSLVPQSKVARAYTISAQYALKDEIYQTIYDIKLKYYLLLKTNSEYELSKTNCEIQENLVKEIEALTKSGKKKQSDLTNAKIALDNARIDLLKAKEKYKVAHELLNNSMYNMSFKNYSIYQTESFQYLPTKQNIFKTVKYNNLNPVIKSSMPFKHPTYTVPEAIDVAFVNNLDLKAIKFLAEAARQLWKYEKYQNFPKVYYSLGYEYGRTNQWLNSYHDGANHSLSFDINIEYYKYNPMKQIYIARMQNAEFKELVEQIRNFACDLNFTVKNARITVNNTHDRIAITKSKMDNATKYFNESHKNYLDNKIDVVLLQNAENCYIKSIQDNINSQYDYNVALIKYEMSMFTNMIDYNNQEEIKLVYDDNNYIDDNNFEKMIYRFMHDGDKEIIQRDEDNLKIEVKEIIQNPRLFTPNTYDLK